MNDIKSLTLKQRLSLTYIVLLLMVMEQDHQILVMDQCKVKKITYNTHENQYESKMINNT